MKLCKDCRFYIAGPDRCFDRCSKNSTFDYVRGVEPRMDYCAPLRDSTLSCGPEGRFFEPARETVEAAE